MKLTLEVKRREVFYTASLAAPVFAALPSEGLIYAAIYRQFAPLGVQLSDIRMEGSALSPGDASVSCTIHPLNALVRYRLDRVEVWWGGGMRVDIPALAEAALAALRGVSPESEVARHHVIVTVHGELREGDLDGWLARHVVPPPAEREPTFSSNGASFGTDLPEGKGVVLVERSLLITGGLFLRVSCELRGMISARAACDRAAGFFATAAEQFGVILQDGG